jgi:hypothetical protein
MYDTLWDPCQAAKFFKVSPRTLERWRYEGRGPRYVKLTNTLFSRVMYRPEDCAAHLEASLRSGTHGAAKAAGKAGKAAKPGEAA